MTFSSFFKFIFSMVSAFVTNTFIRVTAFIENFFDLLFVTVLTVWIKFTGDVFIPVFPVAWSLIVASLFDTSVFWTTDVSRSSSSPRVVAVVTPRLSWSEVFIIGAFWEVWTRISFIVTNPGVAFMTSARFAVAFLVNITDIEGKSVFPPSVSDLSGTFVAWWDAFQQNFATSISVFTINWSKIFFASTWLVTEFSVTFTVHNSAFTVWVTRSRVLDHFSGHFMVWSTFWSLKSCAWWALWWNEASVFTTFNLFVTRPDSSGTTFPWEVSEDKTLWHFLVSWVSFSETSWWNFGEFFTSLLSITSGNSLNFTIDQFFFTLASLAFLGSFPVVFVNFINFRSFNTSISDFNDMTFAFPGLTTTVLNEFSFANFAWVIRWRFASWSIAYFTTLWNWWASAFILVTAWIFWVWSFDLFNFTLSRVTNNFFKVFTANSRFASVSAFFWFTSKTVVAFTFGFTQNLGSSVTSWWTWTINNFRMNRTNTVFSNTVVDNAIVFPWFSTWLVNIT